MRSHLHADDVRPWPSGGRVADALREDLPPVKLRPPWLVFLTKHFAPRNHERYLLQEIELTEEELARIRALPRKHRGGSRFFAGNTNGFLRRRPADAYRRAKPPHCSRCDVS
jgi:hypothetical protein